VSLLGGEGTGLAMLEAYVLASHLIKAGADYRHAFQSYEYTLRPLIKHKQRSARRFASAFAPKTSLGLWTRNQASKLLDIPALADLVIRREFSDDTGLLDRRNWNRARYKESSTRSCGFCCSLRSWAARASS
jgi:2-polyprenyl-6-methoxyphenol hydroxylase-like FAD-dependent oxidoreductase